MKVRTNYVSNSSSSSFVIAYDEMFFGDLISFFKQNYLGCETKVHDSNSMSKFYQYYFDSDEEIEKFKKKVENFEINDKKVIWLEIDQEYEAIVNLLRQINNCTGNKIEFMYESEF